MEKENETKKSKPDTYKGIRLEEMYHNAIETEFQIKLNQIRKETEK